jgi:hypothetical protein
VVCKLHIKGTKHQDFLPATNEPTHLLKRPRFLSTALLTPEMAKTKFNLRNEVSHQQYSFYLAVFEALTILYLLHRTISQPLTSFLKITIST